MSDKQLMTREQWQRKVREAEIAVEAMEKEQGRTLPVWRENLRMMTANPPPRFAPSTWRVKFALMFVSPDFLDRQIMQDWKEGRPPKLPPSPGAIQDILDQFVGKGK
jgi:hypothetical protein